MGETAGGMSKKRRADHNEIIRRLRVGDLRKLLCDRYGPILPDDDAGREDLRWLLLYISAGPHGHIKMPREIEKLAPWMSAKEAEELIDDVNRTPHLPSAKQLGEELQVTNAIRERLRLWTIQACDMTARQARAWRRRKERERFRHLRKIRGAKPHSSSISRTKPWKLAGFNCRSTWERHGKPGPNAANSHGELCRKFARDNTSLVLRANLRQRSKANRPEAGGRRRKNNSGAAQNITKLEEPKMWKDNASGDATDGAMNLRHERGNGAETESEISMLPPLPDDGLYVCRNPLIFAHARWSFDAALMAAFDRRH